MISIIFYRIPNFSQSTLVPKMITYKRDKPSRINFSEAKMAVSRVVIELYSPAYAESISIFSNTSKMPAIRLKNASNTPSVAPVPLSLTEMLPHNV